MEWYLKCIKDNYVNFKGRARRKEYWMFTLINVLISLVAEIIMVIFCDSFIGSIFAILYLVYVLATLLPLIAVTIRRLHDTNRSGWWLLLYLVPIAGPIAVLVFLCLDSTPSENNYGANPKLNDA